MGEAKCGLLHSCIGVVIYVLGALEGTPTSKHNEERLIGVVSHDAETIT